MVLGKNNHNFPTEEIRAIQEGNEEKCLKCVEGRRHVNISVCKAQVVT